MFFALSNVGLPSTAARNSNSASQAAHTLRPTRRALPGKPASNVIASRFHSCLHAPTKQRTVRSSTLHASSFGFVATPAISVLSSRNIVNLSYRWHHFAASSGMSQTIRALTTLSVVTPTTTSSGLSTRYRVGSLQLWISPLSLGVSIAMRHWTNALRQFLGFLRLHAVRSSDAPDDHSSHGLDSPGQHRAFSVSPSWLRMAFQILLAIDSTALHLMLSANSTYPILAFCLLY